MYPPHVVLTLLGMITAGAGRIVAVKIFFQIEVDQSQSVTPLFVTLLYLVGQTLSLVVHYIITRCKHHEKKEIEVDKLIEMADTRSSSDHEDGDRSGDTLPLSGAIDDEKIGKGTVEQNEGLLMFDDEYEIDEEISTSVVPSRPKLKRRGSKTGLTKESKDAVAWVHRIPWYLKPAIPGFCNLCNSALRWGCLVYVAASTAEMLISGMELVFSAFAARIIRKRIISTKRWVGVSIVTLGVILVGFSKMWEKKETEEEHKFFIGNMLIFGQCIFSVLQDLTEEIFMQEANFPATLLLGMEGLFGLIIGIPIYMLFSSENVISFTRFNIAYEIGLIFLVLITGILNIRTTEITSSMTRNVWKQFRIILVWILGLTVYYIGSSDILGEPWVNPGSCFVLGGFSVILTGVYFYYSD